MRNSDFRATGATAVGVDVAPTGASDRDVIFDHSAARTFAATGYGFRTSGSTSRIGSSTLGGVTADVSEGAARAGALRRRPRRRLHDRGELLKPDRGYA